MRMLHDIRVDVELMDRVRAELQKNQTLRCGGAAQECVQPISIQELLRVLAAFPLMVDIHDSMFNTPKVDTGLSLR